MERKCGHPQFWGFWSRTTISWHLQFTLYGFLVPSVSFVFTEDAQEITFHFLNTSVFHFSSKYGKTDANNFEIARAHLFREFKSSKETRQLCERAWPVCISLCCHPLKLCNLCCSTLFYRSYHLLWKQKITNSLFAFLLSPAIDLCCIWIKQYFFPYLKSSTLLSCSFFFLRLKLKEEKGAFDFIIEVTAAVPKCSTCCCPLFLMIKCIWVVYRP